MEYQSPLSMLYKWEEEVPEKIYLRQPLEGIWHTWTWKETTNEVRQLAGALRDLHLPGGSHIGIISKNCAHWIISDLAIMMAGHVSIPLYPNLQAETVSQVLIHSETRLLLVGKLDDWNGMKAGVPENLRCISFPFCKNEDCTEWEEFIKLSRPFIGKTDRRPEETCSIVYTSGTTGMPKGVMFSFSGFSFVAQQASLYMGFSRNERFFSYLPLSHIAERNLVEMISLYNSGEVSFAESLQKFAENLKDTQPTVFLGIHRIWTKFQQSILAKIPEHKLNLLLNIPLVSWYIKRKIRYQLGLSKASVILTGAAPTPPSLIKWFDKLGIKIQEAYAMTENCCYSHMTLKNNIKIGSVGMPFPGCKAMIGDNEEILIHHKALMTGYFKDQEQTAAAFTAEGFLKTGDQGVIDNDGFLRITGRIKDIFKTSKGKYVSPSPIEMKFAFNTDIEQVCIIGSGLPQPLALVILSQQGKERVKNESDEALKNCMMVINENLDAHEKIQKLIVIQDEWTVENNLLTPSFKIKRNEIEKKYNSLYEAWSEQKQVIVTYSA